MASCVIETSVIKKTHGAISLERREEREYFPLTFSQRDMWLQRQIHGEPGLNNVCAEVNLDGPLCEDSFRRALQSVVDRHEALRTIFVERDGVAYQRILPQVEVSYSVRDLSPLPEKAVSGAVSARTRELNERPFDFGSGPLFRAELLRISSDRHVFLFVFNHMILDGIYMAQLFEEVGAFYSGETLPALEVQYPDFAAWQNQRLSEGALRGNEAYWREQLHLPLPAMVLPTDRAASSVESFELGYIEREISPVLFKRLKSLRKQYRTTMFRTVLAAFEILLRRMTGEGELLLGLPFTTLPVQHPGLLGFFGHAVPIRTTLDGGESFASVLADVNRQLSDAREHLEYPLCEALRGLKLERDPHRPFFPVMISQIRNLDVQAGGVRFRMDSRVVLSGVYHLWLTVLERPDGLSLGFYHNRQLLEGDPVNTIADCMTEVLVQIAARPEVRVSEIEILPVSERERVLGFGTGASASGEGASVGGWIAHRTRETPNSIAVVDRDGSLTYQELSRRANRIAHWLRSSGVRPNDRVGILGKRSTGMLTAIVGVLKAGAAFVPLDGSDPEERLRGMARDAGLKCLAVDGEFVERAEALAEECGARLLHWEPACAEWGEACDEEPQWTDVSGRDLAYVLFTSGSTGTPKGAMVEQSGMLNHLRSKIEVLGLSPQDVMAQNASHCFDISVWQFLAPLMAGGRVVILGEEVVLDPPALLQALCRSDVNVLEVVPSYLELLLGLKQARETLGRLRCLISTAETLSVALSRRWFECCPLVPLVNAWGPTECSDDVAHHTMTMAPDAQRVAVGTPIRGSRVYVVDENLELLPVGCEGDIAVGGVCVGRGYLGNADITARTFVPDPFGDEAGARLYLTGDRGRWRAEGTLEFLGRRDGQVKVRGHRIEVGEVEGVLSGHLGVDQAVVEMKAGRLVGYWVGRDNITASELRHYLSQRLPDQMVPDGFVRLEMLPLTRSGKVNRRALPDPDWNLEDTEQPYVAPRTDLERQIAEVWQEALGVARVGVDDDFFDIGGHSLNATRIVLSLRGKLGEHVSIRDLFVHPTVAGLASALEASGPAVTEIQAIPRLPEQPVYPLSPGQKTMWLAFHEVLTSEIPAWGFPSIVRIEGGFDPEVLRRALDLLVDRHELLRSSFAEVAGEPAQVIHQHARIACPMIDFSCFEKGSAAGRLRQFLAEQLAAPMKNQPPLARINLVRMAATTHLVVIQLPHIVSDIWTDRILVEDLSILYTAIKEESQPALSPLPVRYVDYASWLGGKLDTIAMLEQRDYWLGRFSDHVAVPAPPAAREMEQDRSIDLPNELLVSLRSLAAERGTTLFVVLLAALSAMLARLTDSDDVAIGTAVAGRTHPDLERVAGLFLNPLALRTDLSNNPSFGELIERAKHTTLDAMAHQDYPFHLWLHDLRRTRKKNDYFPYSMVLSVEESGRPLDFGGAEGHLESAPSYGLDISNVVGPTSALRVCEVPGGWRAELVPGLLAAAPSARFLWNWADLLQQVSENPKIRLEELTLAAPHQKAPGKARRFETVELSEADLEELLR